jgi:hypothetical protein
LIAETPSLKSKFIVCFQTKEEKQGEASGICDVSDSFDYLLDMPMRSLGFEMTKDLLEKRDDKQRELEQVKNCNNFHHP